MIPLVPPTLYKMDSVQTDYSCPICLLIVEHPVILTECGHNICYECLKDLWQDKQSNGKVACPACRRKTTVPENNI